VVVTGKCVADFIMRNDAGELKEMWNVVRKEVAGCCKMGIVASELEFRGTRLGYENVAAGRKLHSKNGFSILRGEMLVERRVCSETRTTKSNIE
jgi:hypothetical protein